MVFLGVLLTRFLFQYEIWKFLSVTGTFSSCFLKFSSIHFLEEKKGHVKLDNRVLGNIGVTEYDKERERES